MANSKKISKSDIGKLLDQWSKEFTILVPSKESGVAMMVKWDGKDTSFLEWYRNTTIPPKSNLFPAIEEMFSFQKEEEDYHIELPTSGEHKQLIFVILPCDAKSLSILYSTF